MGELTLKCVSPFDRASSCALLIAASAGSVPEAGAAESLSALASYAMNQPAKERGSISVYDIDAGHRLVKTI
jgi:hypothetical protein